MELKPFVYFTADVFTDQPFGGNPLAVFPDADGLSDRQMLKIAQEMNLSETAFVQLPRTPRADCRLRIFTPTGEIPFAGHPTVGTAFVLASLGELPSPLHETTLFFEEGVGPVPVRVCYGHGGPTYGELSAAQMPETQPLPCDRAALAKMLGLPVEALTVEGFEPLGISCGLPFAIVPVASVDDLSQIQFQRDRWALTLEHEWAAAVYAIAPDGGPATADRDRWRVRMFAPGLGIAEDPATGSAATVLGGYLGDRLALTDGTMTWTVVQGIEMGRPSQLMVTVEKTDGQVTAIRVGGASVLLCEGTMHVPMDDLELA